MLNYVEIKLDKNQTQKWRQENADEVDVEDILAQVWHFVDRYYAVKLDTTYQRQMTMGEARFCNKLVMRYIGGEQSDDGLLRYNFNREMFLSETSSI